MGRRSECRIKAGSGRQSSCGYSNAGWNSGRRLADHDLDNLAEVGKCFEQALQRDASEFVISDGRYFWLWHSEDVASLRLTEAAGKNQFVYLRGKGRLGRNALACDRPEVFRPANPLAARGRRGSRTTGAMLFPV